MALLPTIMITIIDWFYPLKSGNAAQLWMQHRYFLFLVIFVVLVTALSETFLRTLSQIVKHPELFMFHLANLPRSSHTYTNYTIVGYFTLAMALLRVSQVCKYLFWRYYGSTPLEAFNDSEPESQEADGMGARMAKATHMMTIALVFSTASPNILFFSFFYFLFGARVYRWLVLYAETKKPDLGGDFWALGLSHIFLSLGVYVMVMLCIMMNATWGDGGPAAVVFLAGIYIVVQWQRFDRIKWGKLPFEELVASDRSEERKGSTLTLDQLHEKEAQNDKYEQWEVRKLEGEPDHIVAEAAEVESRVENGTNPVPARGVQADVGGSEQH